MTLVPRLVDRLLISAGVVKLGLERGHTINSSVTALIVLLSGIFAFGMWTIGTTFGINAAIPNNVLAWVGLVVAFAVSSIVLSPFIFHSWHWDEWELRWRGLFGESEVQWKNVTRVNRTRDGSWVVEDHRGKRVRWSDHTIGGMVILRAAYAARPDLFPDDE